MSIDDDIHIVSITDNHYVQHLGAAYSSLLANIEPGTQVCFHVIDAGLTRVNRMLLELIAERHGADIRFHPFDGGIYENVHTSNHITQAAYYKISIPEMPALRSLSKAIYLDCDLIVTGNIRELWKSDLTGMVIGAVPDLGGNIRLKDLNLPAGFPYFNAGVLLIDMALWRARRITGLAANFVRQYPEKLMYHDQDALNAALFGLWRELPARWNWQTNRIGFRKPSAEPPSIIHFTGSSKPWQYDNDHPYQAEYYKYLQLTGWRSYEPEKTRRAVVKRMTKRVLPRTAYALLTKLKWMFTDK